MKSKIVKCIDCGYEFPRKELNRNFRCRDCAYPAVVRVAQQLHDKKGPEYEKWKRSMEAMAQRFSGQNLAT